MSGTVDRKRNCLYAFVIGALSTTLGIAVWQWMLLDLGIVVAVTVVAELWAWAEGEDQ